MAEVLSVLHALTSDLTAMEAFASDRAGFLAAKFPELSSSSRSILMGTNLQALTGAVAQEIAEAVGGDFPVHIFYPGLQAEWAGLSPLQGPARTPLEVRIRLKIGPEEVKQVDELFRQLRDAEAPKGLWFRRNGVNVRGAVLHYELDRANALLTLHVTVTLDQTGSWAIGINDGAGELLSSTDFVAFDWTRRT